jgi:hypothetical protein
MGITSGHNTAMGIASRACGHSLRSKDRGWQQLARGRRGSLA